MNSKKKNTVAEWDYPHDLLFWFDQFNNESNKKVVSEPTFIVKNNSEFIIEESTSYVKGSKGEQLFYNINAIKAIKNHLEGFAVNGLKSHLAKFNGFGNLSELFDKAKDVFKKERAEIDCLLTKDEYEAARESTLTAFYTPEHIINAIFKTLIEMGFDGGTVLDPAMGSGRFFQFMPEKMKQSSRLFGVELDQITGQIAKALYDDANIQVTGFERATLSDNLFDVIVGNVPFGNFKVYDPDYKNHNLLIHDYFFVKSLDKLRDGGVLAFITSKGTMDKKDDVTRQLIANKAELIGAVRLPNTAFKSAGAEVTTDVLFLQKKGAGTKSCENWMNVVQVGDVQMNEYFFHNPEMVVGEMKLVSGQFGPTSECVNTEFKEGDADYAFSLIKGVIEKQEVLEVESQGRVISANPGVKNFSYTIENDVLYYREGSIMVEPKINAKAKERILALISLRDKVKQIISLQLMNCSDSELSSAQEDLLECYNTFQSDFGLISSRGNALAFQADESYFLLSSLEKIDDEGALVGLADIFTKRTICNVVNPTSAKTSKEALTISLGMKGCVDISFMSELTSFSEEKIASDLVGEIFKNPSTNEYEAADEYLSGEVKRKLEIAKNFVQSGKTEYQVNVQALEKEQPTPLGATDVAAKLGSHWIPAKYIKEFVVALLDLQIPSYSNFDVIHNESHGEWFVPDKDSYFIHRSAKATKVYGTSRKNAAYLIEDLLNQKSSVVYDNIDGRQVVNQKETLVAVQRQELIRDKFREWVYANQDRREDLLSIYNNLYNVTRLRNFNGDAVMFQGMNPEIRLMKHQKDGVARALYGGNTLLAHVVGAGKTYTIIASIMEKKRLGLCTKAMIVVPNHLTAQWAAEFYRLYPSANLLVTRTKDFDTKNRKRFCSRIAMENVDAVIIGHSQFERIPMSQEYQEAYMQSEIDSLEEEINSVNSNDWTKQRTTVKSLERKKKSLNARLEKLMAKDRKDNVLDFEDLGIDLLCIDEAHNYKNLYFHTKMTGVAGLSTTDSQKSSDVFMKCRYLCDKTNNKGIIFATGTPVMNSIVELYTMMKYLQFDTLKELGLAHFDSWAADFAETTTTMELAPEGTGYRSRTRFSRFDNMPELMGIFHQVADVKVADQLNLPTPLVNFHTVTVEPTDYQLEYVSCLGDRAEAIRNGAVDRREDNMLNVTNDGRKLGLDQRLIHSYAEDDMDSKVNQMISNVYRIWNETKADSLTQLVFCDLSTPKANTEHNNLFTDVYNDIRHKLVAMGIPYEEIAFIHNAKTDVQKKKLFEKVQSGTIRILMGSTQKCGAGTNVQEKLVALHDLDCPWRPGDLEQRLGRIERQGNTNAEVDVYRYVTKSTFDAYLWQTIENKQKFISQVLTSKSPSRSCEDIDEATLSYAEIKALCVGDERIKEKMSLDVEVSKLNILKATHKSNIYALESEIKQLPISIKDAENAICKIESDVSDLQASNKEYVIDEVHYSSAEFVSQLLYKKRKETKEKVGELFIGSYKHFALSMTTVIGTYKLHYSGAGRYSIDLSYNEEKVINSLNGIERALQQRLEDHKENIKRMTIQLAEAKVEVLAKFPYEAVLEEKKARLSELDLELNVGKLES